MVKIDMQLEFIGFDLISPRGWGEEIYSLHWKLSDIADLTWWFFFARIIASLFYFQEQWTFVEWHE